MNKHKLYIALSLLAAACLLLGACGGVPPEASNPATSALTAEEVAAKAVEQMGKLETFKVDMTINMTATMPVDNKAETMTMTQTGNGSVDVPNKQMTMDMDVVTDVPGEGRREVSMAMYDIGGWFYMKMNVPGSGEQWMKTENAGEAWAGRSQLSTMTDFLKTAVKVELAGSETVGGADCYILQITPDLARISTWINNQIMSSQLDIDLSGIDLAKFIKNATLKQWVGKASFLPVKQVMSFGVGIDMGALAKIDAQLDASLLYSDFGKPVTVQLPPEAASAKELSLSSSRMP